MKKKCETSSRKAIAWIIFKKNIYIEAFPRYRRQYLSFDLTGSEGGGGGR
jgi:hypothetical protein